MSNSINHLFELLFGEAGSIPGWVDNAIEALFLSRGFPYFRVRKVTRRIDGVTRPEIIPVYDIGGKPMYVTGDDGKPVTDRNGNKIPITVPLYNSFLGEDIKGGKVPIGDLRYVDISSLLRDKSPDQQALIIKHAIQRDLFDKILACKKGNAVDTPVRLLVCSDSTYATGRGKDYFNSPQDLIAYGKVLTTSHEVIGSGTFTIKVVEEGDFGTANGQSRLSTDLATWLGYRNRSQLQFRMELKGLGLVTGSTISGTFDEVDLVIPGSSFKGVNPPKTGIYTIQGRIGIMASARHRHLTISDNIEVQHYYSALNFDIVNSELDALKGAHRDAKRYLELIKDVDERPEDRSVVNALFKGLGITSPNATEDAQYVADMLMLHPYVANKVYDYLLSRYASIARTGAHKFAGAYLACLEALPDGCAFAPEVGATQSEEWMFRIPLLSAGNIRKIQMLSEDDMYDLLNGDAIHDAEIMNAISSNGSVFVNSNTADKLNSDFDMDPICRVQRNDPYWSQFELIRTQYGDMRLASKNKTRKRSPWNRFGVADAVAEFISAPNIGSLTLLQHNIMLKVDDRKAKLFLKKLGLTIKSAAELVGMATQVAVDSHKWTARLTADEQNRLAKLMKYFSGKSPAHRTAVSSIRAGETNINVKEEHFLDELVLTVAEALEDSSIGDIMETFVAGSYIGFLGVPSEDSAERLMPEVLERLDAYNKSIAAVLSSTKEGSHKRDQAIGLVCEQNRMDFAHVRGLLSAGEFMDYVRLAWDAAHQAASRSVNQSKASFVFTAGVADVIVECLNDTYGGFGHVKEAYGAGETCAPRINVFNGWQEYLPAKVNAKALTNLAFGMDDQAAQDTVHAAVAKWAKKVVGATVSVGVASTPNGRNHTVAIFKGSKVVGEIRSSLVRYGQYTITSATPSGVHLIVVLTPVMGGAGTSRHRLRVVRIWQNCPASALSKAEKVARAMKALATAGRIAGVRIVPGARGVDLMVGRMTIGSIMSSATDESVVLGSAQLVKVEHQPGKLSAVITVDKVAANA